MKHKKGFLSLHVYLSYLLIATVMFTGVSFARYVTIARGGDSSQVAAFIVEAAGAGSEALAIDCADPEAMSAEYVIHVTNQHDGKVCAIATAYQIEVELPEALPEGLAMELYRGADQILPTDDRGEAVVYPGAAHFAPFEAEDHTYTLRFTVEDPQLFEEDVSISGIRVNVTAEQID